MTKQPSLQSASSGRSMFAFAPQSTVPAARDWFYLIGMCAAASALHWGLYFDGFYAISWDESGRVLDTYNWLKHRFFFSDASWLPGYRVLVGSALALHYDLFLTPRVVTYVCGLVVIFGVGWLTHELFHCRPLTWTAIAYGTLFPQRIALGLAPLSSIIFTALIVLAFSLLAGGLGRASRRWLYLSSILFAIAGTVRVEGWFFSLFLWVGLIVIARKGRIHLAAGDIMKLALILGTFPAVWIWTGLYRSGQLAILENSGLWPFTPAELILKNPIVEFVSINLPCLNLIGLISAIRLFRQREDPRFVLTLAGLSLVIIGVALWLAGQVQTGPSWRMTTVWGTLLIPFAAHTSWNAGNVFSQPRMVRAARFAAIALICSASLHQLLSIRSASQWAFTASDRHAGQYMERLLDAGPGSVLIESFNYYYLPMVTAAQHPDRFIRNSRPEDRDDTGAKIAAGRDIDWPALRQLGIRYLVFRQEAIRQRLAASGKVVKIAGFGPWSVYEISAEEIKTKPGARPADRP